MKRQDLINKIERLDQSIAQRSGIITAQCSEAHNTLKRVPGAWLIGIGAAAGAITGIIGPGRFYSYGLTGGHLLPLTKNAFSLGKQFGLDGEVPGLGEAEPEL